MTVFEIISAVIVAVIALVSSVFVVQVIIDSRNVPYIVNVQMDHLPLIGFQRRLHQLCDALHRRPLIKHVEFMHSDIVNSNYTVFALLIYLPKGVVVSAAHAEVLHALRSSQINYKRVDVLPHPHENKTNHAG